MIQIQWPIVTGLLIVLLVGLSLYKAHRDPDNDINVFHLIMENGKISKIACVFIGAWGAMTYVFIGLFLQGKMTEGLFTAYGGLFIVPLIARMFSGPSTSTTVSTTNTTEITQEKKS